MTKNRTAQLIFQTIYCTLGLVGIVQTVRKKENSYVKTLPIFKFITMAGILLTFLVFNLLLAGAEGRDPQMNWKVGSLLFHVVLPIMYIADWLLFYERKTTKWYYPFLTPLFPFFYAVFIYIHAALLGFNSEILIPGTKTPLIYPYFFLNLDTQGVLGVAKWLFLIFVALVTMGYIFMGLNHIGKKRKNK